MSAFVWDKDRSPRADCLARRVPLLDGPTPLQPMTRLAHDLPPQGAPPRLFVKRDDAIAFGAGGNKVRKLEVLGYEMLGAGTDVVITTGGVQSNHARATAALAARLGIRCVIVANGEPPVRPTGNALLARALGAEIHYVATREERAPAMEAIAARLVSEGRCPRIVPLGASEPLGALAFALAVGELLEQGPPPEVIFHSSSSGGTQAGLVAGCALHGIPTRVIGISADEPKADLEAAVRRLVEGVEDLLGLSSGALAGTAIEVDDAFVGEGYGVPSAASREAADRAVRLEGLFLDQTYTAKAMAGMLEHLRSGRLSDAASVVFWHTGGFPGIFA
jgi:1-aminocyclopropane-1-carboxylate deaminase/D-cysteine desulfhydrase-like pyridoxal-dependent ACC family enzyme